MPITPPNSGRFRLRYRLVAAIGHLHQHSHHRGPHRGTAPPSSKAPPCPPKPSADKPAELLPATFQQSGCFVAEYRVRAQPFDDLAAAVTADLQEWSDEVDPGIAALLDRQKANRSGC